VFQQKVPEGRPQDAHDIVGTFELVEAREESRRVTDAYDDSCDCDGWTAFRFIDAAP